MQTQGFSPVRLFADRSVMARLVLKTMSGSGALLLALGLVVWTGHGDGLIPVHVLLGFVFVSSLLTLSVLAARAGVSLVPVSLAASCGLIVLALGAAQEQLLTGDWHWTVKVLHVVTSMGAMAWGRRLGFLMRQNGWT